MNPFEMVAIIVVAVMIASVLRAKYSHRRRDEDADPREHAEALRLRGFGRRVLSLSDRGR